MYFRFCPECKTSFLHPDKRTVYCSSICRKNKTADNRRKTCLMCSEVFDSGPKKRATCSDVCHRARLSEIAQDQAKESSHRMTVSNPMKRTEVIDKMKRTKTLNGTLRLASHLNGGNGRGPTKPQLLLWENLEGAVMEFSVSCGKRKKGYPSNYKIDICLPHHKIAIEVDGSSHNSSKARAVDAKKDSFLTSLGWTVLRFTNKSILKDVDAVVMCIDEKVSKLTSMHDRTVHPV